MANERHMTSKVLNSMQIVAVICLTDFDLAQGDISYSFRRIIAGKTDETTLNADLTHFVLPDRQNHSYIW